MNYTLKNFILAPLNLLYNVSPEVALKVLFKMKNGYKLHLTHPVTYNEKLQWVKLYYNNPLLPKLVDKYTVRGYIEKIAPETLTKLYWNGFNANEIPWDRLPDKFVIKVTHGSGFNIICKDKSKLDKDKAIVDLNKWLKTKFLKCYGEWFYGAETPRIIIEEYLDNGTGKEPEDYKVLCFGGEAKFIIVDTDRFVEHKRNIYDLNWNFRSDVTMDFKNDKPMSRPSNLDEILRYAELLSKGFPHVRVDLYDVGGKIYFGEMTFTNGAGFDPIRPHEFDIELGSYFKIPE